jgi:hypothetical protein
MGGSRSGSGSRLGAAVVLVLLLLPLLLVAGQGSGQVGPRDAVGPDAAGQSPQPPSETAPDRFLVSYGDGRLTVKVNEVPAPVVFREISRLTGVKISVVGSLRGPPLTATFENVTLDDGLRRLLGRLDYVFLYASGPEGAAAPGARLSAVIIHAGKATGGPRAPASGPAPPSRETKNRPETDSDDDDDAHN